MREGSSEPDQPDASPEVAYEQLQREKDFVEKLIQGAPTIVLVLDERGRVLRCNSFLEKLTGYRLDEIQGKDWFTTFLPDSHRPATRHLLAEIVSHRHGTTNTNPIVTKEGSLREIEWSNRTLTDEQGNVVAVLAIGHDVTELKAAQKRALQAERLAAIGEMVAGLAHESRNALQRSQACLEMLALEVEDRPEALDLVGRIQIAQDHLHHLYEEVRSYAAPIVLHRELVRLAEFVDEVWCQLEPSRRGRSARLDVNRHIREGCCRIDRAEASHILAYLIKPIKEADLAPAIAVAMRRFEQIQALGRKASNSQQALEDRKIVERAKGILMKRSRLGEEDAFRRLQKLATQSNRKLVEVARALLAADVDP